MSLIRDGPLFLEGGGLGNFLGYEFFSPLKVGHDCFLEGNSLLKDFFFTIVKWNLT